MNEEVIDEEEKKLNIDKLEIIKSDYVGCLYRMAKADEKHSDITKKIIKIKSINQIKLKYLV